MDRYFGRGDRAISIERDSSGIGNGISGGEPNDIDRKGSSAILIEISGGGIERYR